MNAATESKAIPMNYPLQFEPRYRQYIWGGRRFESVLGRELGEGERFAESWEVVDHGQDQSVVANGPLQGQTLHQLIDQEGRALLGRHYPQTQFPLLFKFLDCNRNLSVQVHPDDARARQLDPPDLGKTEAWIILDAEPGAKVYAGLKRGFDRGALAREVARGTTELCLHSFEPQPGDCIFVPAGVLHALGAGLLVAEIQQASDTTYRLFDWNRVDTDGKPRPLHIEETLEATDYDRGPVSAVQPQVTDQPHVDNLVTCDKFILDRWNFDSEQTLEMDNRFHLIAVLSGNVEVVTAGQSVSLGAAQTSLVPASCGTLTLRPKGPSVMLDIYLP